MCHDHGDYGRHGHGRDPGGRPHEYRHGDHGPDGGPDRPDRPRDGGECGCDCGCHEEGFGFRRQFVSKAEVIATMREYLEDLENEAQGVREAIAELEAEAAAAAAPRAGGEPG
jgi:hypothetical protein